MRHIRTTWDLKSFAFPSESLANSPNENSLVFTQSSQRNSIVFFFCSFYLTITQIYYISFGCFQSLLNRVPAWSTCPRAHVPKACRVFIFMCYGASKCAKVVPIFQPGLLAYQRRVNFLTWRVNVPNSGPIFHPFIKKNFSFLNFSAMFKFSHFKNIWAILENLLCETKNLNFGICKNCPY